ncbi:hypothetical protein R6Q59_028196 [Mikania micrantha]
MVLSNLSQSIQNHYFQSMKNNQSRSILGIPLYSGIRTRKKMGFDTKNPNFYHVRRSDFRSVFRPRTYGSGLDFSRPIEHRGTTRDIDGLAQRSAGVGSSRGQKKITRVIAKMSLTSNKGKKIDYKKICRSPVCNMNCEEGTYRKRGSTGVQNSSIVARNFGRFRSDKQIRCVKCRKWVTGQLIS